jgi:Arc/MetJ-type ribon-helix-helix transcriptional regulator
MDTINISLPKKLKSETEKMVKAGYYASFSDVTRMGLREMIRLNRYQRWLEEAKQEVKEGKAITLRSKKDIDQYFNSISVK